MAEASTSYRVLPVRLISPSGGPPLTRYLYVRPHSNPEDGLPKDRAVFVAGIPLQLQGTPLVDLFGQFGDIERAALHSTRVSAVLLYAAAAGRDKLMRATGTRRPVQLQLPEPQETHGLKGVRVACRCTGMNRQQRQEAAHRRGGLACACAGRMLSVPHANGLQASHFTVHPLCSLECSLGGGAPGAEAGQCGAAGTLGLDSALGGAAVVVCGHVARDRSSESCPDGICTLPNLHLVQAALDEYMEEWEAEDAAKRAAALKADEEEGCTVVQRNKVGVSAWTPCHGGRAGVMRLAGAAGARLTCSLKGSSCWGLGDAVGC